MKAGNITGEQKTVDVRLLVAVLRLAGSLTVTWQPPFWLPKGLHKAECSKS